jgi:hypothetical protein
MSALEIRIRKLSDERHSLEIVRPDGRRELVECETRSYLRHDLLHYAVESEAGLESGFWGKLASGTTLARMNDREALPPGGGEEGEDLAAIEQIVGALHNSSKGPSASELVTGLSRFAEALGSPLPSWVSVSLVERVQEAMRRLEGHWRATPYAAVMELRWPK